MICQYKTLLLELKGVILKENNEIDQSFVDFAEGIKDKYQLVLVSDGKNAEIEKVCEKHGILKYFDAKILSEEAGCKKPSIEIFDFALSRIGKKPSECIIVDCDVKSLLFAEEVGISAMFFNRNGENFDGMAVCDFKELFDIIG